MLAVKCVKFCTSYNHPQDEIFILLVWHGGWYWFVVIHSGIMVQYRWQVRFTCNLPVVCCWRLYREHLNSVCWCGHCRKIDLVMSASHCVMFQLLENSQLSSWKLKTWRKWTSEDCLVHTYIHTHTHKQILFNWHIIQCCSRLGQYPKVNLWDRCGRTFSRWDALPIISKHCIILMCKYVKLK